jgi:hypothetical protein
LAATAPATARGASGRPSAPGELAVGHQRGRRNAQQGFPDLELEVGAASAAGAAAPLAARWGRRGRPVAPAPASSRMKLRRRPVGCAARRLRAASISPSQKARWHMPRGVQANSASPSGVAAMPWRSSTPAPPLLISPGVSASQLTVRSCSRPGPERPACQRGIEHVGRGAQHAASACSLVRYCKNRLGEIPAQAENTRCNWCSLKCAAAATLGQRRLAPRVGAHEGDGAGNRRVVARGLVAQQRNQALAASLARRQQARREAGDQGRAGDHHGAAGQCVPADRLVQDRASRRTLPNSGIRKVTVSAGAAPRSSIRRKYSR